MIEIQFKALLLYLNFPVIPAFAGMTNKKLLSLTFGQGFFA